jgi:copper chaperone CopZ
MKKIIVIITALFLTATSRAQVVKVSLQASGLTCSMCSNAINKSLKTLDFTDKVESNIKNSSFDIFFKPGAAVDFDMIKKKVEDAGFFVASFQATLHFNNIPVANDTHIESNGKLFHFLNTKDQVINGDITVKLLDKGFVTSKLFKQNAGYTSKECYKSGTTAACCEKQGLKQGTRIYHVTI